MNKKPKVRANIKKAVKIVGLAELGRRLGITYQTIIGWQERNVMPDREYSGRTLHAAGIEYHTDGGVTIKDVLGFVPEPQEKELARLKRYGA